MYNIAISQTILSNERTKYLEENIQAKKGAASNNGKHCSIFLAHALYLLTRFLENKHIISLLEVLNCWNK